MVDSRISKRGWVKGFHESKINSIQQSPVDDNILLTASSGMHGKISVHDLRMVHEFR